MVNKGTVEFLKYPCCGAVRHNIPNFDLKDILDGYNILYSKTVCEVIVCLRYNKLLTYSQAFKYIKLINRLHKIPKIIYRDLSRFFNLKFLHCPDCGKIWLRENLKIIERDLDFYICSNCKCKVLDIKENAVSRDKYHKLKCPDCGNVFKKIEE